MLTDFGRRVREAVECTADELKDALPAWGDEDRRAVERILTVHLLLMHAHGLRDAARLVRLDTELSMSERNRVADSVLQLITDRREWVP